MFCCPIWRFMALHRRHRTKNNRTTYRHNAIEHTNCNVWSRARLAVFAFVTYRNGNSTSWIFHISFALEHELELYIFFSSRIYIFWSICIVILLLYRVFLSFSQYKFLYMLACSIVFGYWILLPRLFMLLPFASPFHKSLCVVSFGLVVLCCFWVL